MKNRPATAAEEGLNMKRLFALVVCAAAVISLAISSNAFETLPEAERNDSRRDSQEVTFGSEICGSIGSLTDLDVYKYTAEIGREVEVKLSGIPEGKSWFLWVMSADWKELERSAEINSRSQELSFEVEEGVTYYIAVNARNKPEDNFSADGESYTLTVGVPPIIILPDAAIDLGGIDKIVYTTPDPSVPDIEITDKKSITEVVEMLASAEYETAKGGGSAGGPSIRLIRNGYAAGTILPYGGTEFGISIDLSYDETEFRTYIGKDGFWSAEEWKSFFEKNGSAEPVLRIPLTNGQEGFSAVNLGNVDRLGFYTSPAAVNPSTEDAELIERFVEMLAGIELGEPVYTGGINGGTSMTLYSGDAVVFSFVISESGIHHGGWCYPIAEGGWSAREWLEFAHDCDGRFDAEAYAKLFKVK